MRNGLVSGATTALLLLLAFVGFNVFAVYSIPVPPPPINHPPSFVCGVMMGIANLNHLSVDIRTESVCQ